MVKIQYATISETGTRKNNEDAFRMIGTSDGNRWLAVVCEAWVVMTKVKWQVKRWQMPL